MIDFTAQKRAFSDERTCQKLSSSSHRVHSGFIEVGKVLHISIKNLKPELALASVVVDASNEKGFKGILCHVRRTVRIPQRNFLHKKNIFMYDKLTIDNVNF
jgi:hypothetical protein